MAGDERIAVSFLTWLSPRLLLIVTTSGRLELVQLPNALMQNTDKRSAAAFELLETPLHRSKVGMVEDVVTSVESCTHDGAIWVALGLLEGGVSCYRLAGYDGCPSPSSVLSLPAVVDRIQRSTIWKSMLPSSLSSDG